MFYLILLAIVAKIALGTVLALIYIASACAIAICSVSDWGSRAYVNSLLLFAASGVVLILIQ